MTRRRRSLPASGARATLRTPPWARSCKSSASAESARSELMPMVPPAAKIFRQRSRMAGWSLTAAPTRPILRRAMTPGSTWVHRSERLAFPGRAVDKPGGAEAAAPGAAPAGLHQKHLAPLALGGQEVAVGRVGGQVRQMGGGYPLGETQARPQRPPGCRRGGSGACNPRARRRRGRCGPGPGAGRPGPGPGRFRPGTRRRGWRRPRPRPGRRRPRREITARG